jgi:hypothetical protein
MNHTTKSLHPPRPSLTKEVMVEDRLVTMQVRPYLCLSHPLFSDLSISSGTPQVKSASSRLELLSIAVQIAAFSSTTSTTPSPSRRLTHGGMSS